MTASDYRMTTKGDKVSAYFSNSEHIALVLGKTMSGKKLILETTLANGRRYQIQRNYARCQICDQSLPIGKKKR